MHDLLVNSNGGKICCQTMFLSWVYPVKDRFADLLQGSVKFTSLRNELLSVSLDLQVEKPDQATLKCKCIRSKTPLYCFCIDIMQLDKPGPLFNNYNTETQFTSPHGNLSVL